MFEVELPWPCRMGGTRIVSRLFLLAYSYRQGPLRSMGLQRYKTLVPESPGLKLTPKQYATEYRLFKGYGL
jgi:hypothetical protein